jgi:hypothetical protein
MSGGGEGVPCVVNVHVQVVPWAKVTRELLRITCYAVLTWSVLNSWDIGTDDSDVDGWHRSGMSVLTDHKTGLQYLSDGHGGMIRRGNP